MGIEPTYLAWKASVLPLNYTRIYAETVMLLPVSYTHLDVYKRQRFYRSNSVRKQEGVGIGLYLARQIISGEDGYIKVASVPGKGSTFSIFLPK